jgi:hypothetical protein
LQNVTREESASKMDQWRSLAEKHGCSVEAVAVAFAALPSAVEKVVMQVPARNPVLAGGS